MTSRFQISNNDVTVNFEVESPKFAEPLNETLPFESSVSTWGDEIYFSIPVELPSNELTRDVQVGDVAYWPGGQALAFFFGPTPISNGDQPVPADDVNIIGSVIDDPQQLRSFPSGSSVTLSKSD